MVEVTGSVIEQSVENGSLRTVFRIPAQSEGLAVRQANLNAGLKGYSGIEVVNTEKISEGSLPGQSIYAVTVTSRR